MNYFYLYPTWWISESPAPRMSIEIEIPSDGSGDPEDHDPSDVEEGFDVIDLERFSLLE